MEDCLVLSYNNAETIAFDIKLLFTTKNARKINVIDLVHKNHVMAIWKMA